ncbi:hypothetical protein L6279_01010 [Candidatus Parcubacteria bacterium]|nr:hypothetical protein [Patescibacteria group bacterium]MBU4467072.1 hypothetical protein [Patescibacteria group bacterium]MCG2688106.1 hypothetical protein [Candidatus Parcubacteria bacterium]MCG2692672.1 hypothetical protein [Candidatus Parcubacteria bacterium]
MHTFRLGRLTVSVKLSPPSQLQPYSGIGRFVKETYWGDFRIGGTRLLELIQRGAKRIILESPEGYFLAIRITGGKVKIVATYRWPPPGKFIAGTISLKELKDRLPEIGRGISLLRDLLEITTGNQSIGEKEAQRFMGMKW